MNNNHLKWSKYNHIFQSSKYGFLLYNSATNSFAELDEELYNELIQIKSNSELISELNPDIFEDLRKAKVLVSEEDEDSIFYAKKFRYLLRSYNRNGLSLTIAPTINCNFSCPYCYENNSNIEMSDETIKDLIEFIKSFEKKPILSICWFGGEPLLAFENMKKIIEGIYREGITVFHQNMITNGYLLTGEVCDFFKEYGLNELQVTIDGNKGTHNSRRKHKTDEDSYSVILNNIDHLIKVLPNTRVNIRVNIDSTNRSEFVDVYNFLSNRWSGANIYIYPGFVTDYSLGCTQSNCELNREERMKFYRELYKTHKINVAFYPQHRANTCVADNINSYVIGPQGEFYKCWCDMGVSDRIIGYINKENVANPELLAEYMTGYSMYDDPECKKCKLFPVCNGGCRWYRMERKKDKHKYSCTQRKENLDEILEFHYEQRILNNQELI